jgi:hypothetical protein
VPATLDLHDQRGRGPAGGSVCTGLPVPGRLSSQQGPALSPCSSQASPSPLHRHQRSSLLAANFRNSSSAESRAGGFLVKVNFKVDQLTTALISEV